MEFTATPRPAGSRRLGFVLLAAALAASACGSASASSASTTTTTAARGASLGAFTRCLTSHGVPASALPRRPPGAGARPDGTGGSPPTSGATGSPATTAPGRAGGGLRGLTTRYGAAFTACRSLLPAGARNGFRAGLNSARFAAYRNCLELHGVTLPTGPPGSAPATTPGASGAVRSSPAFQAARKACASLLPTRPATGSTTTSTTTPPAAAA